MMQAILAGFYHFKKWCMDIFGFGCNERIPPPKDPPVKNRIVRTRIDWDNMDNAIKAYLNANPRKAKKQIADEYGIAHSTFNKYALMEQQRLECLKRKRDALRLEPQVIDKGALHND